MQITVKRPSELTWTEIQSWRALQQANAHLDSPFLSPGWALAVEEAQGATSKARVAVITKGGEAQGFFAFSAGAITAMPIGAPLCDYQAVISAPDLQIKAAQLVRACGVQRFDFCHMRDDDPVFSRFEKTRDVSFQVDLRDSYGTYAQKKAEEKSKLLKDAEQKFRKMAKDNGQMQFIAQSESKSCFDALIHWKNEKFRATGQTVLFEHEWPRKLLELLFTKDYPGAKAVLFTLMSGEDPVAGHLHLVSDRTVHAWQIVHDPRFDRYSPGIVMFNELLKWMDGRYDTLDMGPVHYGFKNRFANRLQPVVIGFAGPPSPCTFIRAAEYQLRRTFEELPLGMVSELPGKAMRRWDLLRALKA